VIRKRWGEWFLVEGTELLVHEKSGYCVDLSNIILMKSNFGAGHEAVRQFGVAIRTILRSQDLPSPGNRQTMNHG